MLRISAQVSFFKPQYFFIKRMKTPLVRKALITFIDEVIGLMKLT